MRCFSPTRIVAALSLVMVAISGCSSAASTVSANGLQYAFKTRAYSYHATAALKGTITAEDPGGRGSANIPIDGSIGYDLNLKVRPGPNGTGQVEQQIANGYADMTMGGQSASQPMPDALLTLQMDPTGKVIGVQGLDSLVLDAQFLNARHYREMMAQVLAEFPAGKVKKPGDRWETTVKLDVPGGSEPVTAVIKSEYKGNERKAGASVARIEHKAEIPVNMTRRAQGATFSISGQDRVETVSYVDLKTGFPVAADTKIAYLADQQVDDGRMKMRMKMNLTTDVKLERAE